MWETLLAAFGLMLVIEGLLPFVNPVAWRAVFERVLRLTDGQIRFFGMGSMLGGLVILLLLWG